MWKKPLSGLMLAVIAALGAPALRAASINVAVTDAGGKPVQDAVVYVERADRKRLTAKAPTGVMMDQRDKEFVPYVLPIMVGTSVTFPNNDNILHHVYSFSPAKKFELPLYKGKPAEPVLFDKPGVVIIGCNIHDWMLAYIVVLETPYFVKTKKNGTGTIELPVDLYDIYVWHPRMKEPIAELKQRRKLTGNESVTFKISLKNEWRPQRGLDHGGGRY